LDALFLATPVANKGSLTQYAGRILRSHESKTMAEVHDYPGHVTFIG
jgi:superfamily II DNA or RNA helicase